MKLKCYYVSVIARDINLYVYAQSLSHIQLFATPWTTAQQALLSMRFSRQEYWGGCHFLLQAIFLTQGSKRYLLFCTG